MTRKEVFQTIIGTAEAITPKLVEERHDFHKYAEGGWFEMRTTSLIARRLKELGFDEVLLGDQVMKRDVRMSVPSDEVLDAEYARALAQGADPEFVPYTKGGMTGCIGILHCGDGPVVGMRFDIDALGIPESTDPDHMPCRLGYASVNNGFMHACGHDSHAVIGLGVAEVLMKIRNELHGTIKLIFQPHEEGVAGGAQAIVANGHLDDMMYMIGSHATKRKNEAPGTALVPGMHGSLATSKWGLVIHGHSVHAAGCPELGHDALLAAATIILELNAIARHSAGATRIGIGKVRDDSVVNAISDEVHLDFEIRGQTNELCDYMLGKAKRIIEHSCAMQECTYELVCKGAAESFVSSAPLLKRIRRVCTEDLGLLVSAEDSMKGGGSEDCSYFINKVQANGGESTFMRVLTDMTGVAHARNYNIDNEVLIPNAVKAFCGTVYDIVNDPDALIKRA